VAAGVTYWAYKKFIFPGPYVPMARRGVEYEQRFDSKWLTDKEDPSGTPAPGVPAQSNLLDSRNTFDGGKASAKK
jgi:hypothetical protein